MHCAFPYIKGKPAWSHQFKKPSDSHLKHFEGCKAWKENKQSNNWVLCLLQSQTRLFKSGWNEARFTKLVLHNVPNHCYSTPWLRAILSHSDAAPVPLYAKMAFDLMRTRTRPHATDNLCKSTGQNGCGLAAARIKIGHGSNIQNNNKTPTR